MPAASPGRPHEIERVWPSIRRPSGRADRWRPDESSRIAGNPAVHPSLPQWTSMPPSSLPGARDRTPARPQLRGGPLAKVVGAGLQIGARARERTVVPELLEQLPGDGLEALDGVL